jgi:hypothetical protein
VASTVHARTARPRLKQLTRAALGLAAFALASSVLATPRLSPKPSPAAAEHRVQVVLVTLDGARYQEIFGGVDAELARAHGLADTERVDAGALMPELHALMTRHGSALGAPSRGAPILASGPDFVSLPGYSEIFTGRRVTGCRDNGCRGTDAASVVDQLAAEPGTNVAVVTSWPDIARVATSTTQVLVSAGRHGGATRTRFERSDGAGLALRRAEPEPPWPGQGDFRRDRFTAELALAYLREAKPGFLFVGLGETDEFAHQGNYPGYLAALREADRYLGELWRELEAARSRGVRTALVVTADHGRAAGFRDHGRAFPESARVWLVAAGSLIGARGRLAAPREARLADIAPTLRTWFGLRADSHESAGRPLTLLSGLTAGTRG